MVRGMLKTAKLSSSFWGEALLHAAFLHSVTYSRVLEGKNPHEALLGVRPDNARLRIFGCEAFLYVHKEQGTRKLSDHAVRGILLGHRDGMYRVYVPKTGYFIYSKHVLLNETNYPAAELGQGPTQCDDIDIGIDTVLFEGYVEEDLSENSLYDSQQQG